MTIHESLKIDFDKAARASKALQVAIEQIQEKGSAAMNEYMQSRICSSMAVSEKRTEIYNETREEVNTLEAKKEELYKELAYLAHCMDKWGYESFCAGNDERRIALFKALRKAYPEEQRA
jgi:hypothetical protein